MRRISHTYITSILSQFLPLFKDCLHLMSSFALLLIFVIYLNHKKNVKRFQLYSNFSNKMKINGKIMFKIGFNEFLVIALKPRFALAYLRNTTLLVPLILWVSALMVLICVVANEQEDFCWFSEKIVFNDVFHYFSNARRDRKHIIDNFIN